MVVRSCVLLSMGSVLVVVFELFVYCYVWESVIVLCFVVRYSMSILVLQSL